MTKRNFFGAICALLLVLIVTSGCNKYTPPSPLDGIWLVESVENNSGLPMPAYAETADGVYWEFQNVLFRITYIADASKSISVRQTLWGYPAFDGNEITFTPNDLQKTNAVFPVPGGTNLPELRLRYETSHGKLTLYGENYVLHLVRR